MDIVSSISDFRRKRIPDGAIRKRKAYICVQGFKQKEGIDYFETFTSVVQWMIGRVCFIMIILLNLHKKQSDYTATFLQAPLDHEVYIETPKTLTIPSKVWLLKRSLYGLKYAPRAYFIHTKNKLEGLEFR